VPGPSNTLRRRLPITIISHGRTRARDSPRVRLQDGLCVWTRTVACVDPAGYGRLDRPLPLLRAPPAASRRQSPRLARAGGDTGDPAGPSAARSIVLRGKTRAVCPGGILHGVLRMDAPRYLRCPDRYSYVHVRRGTSDCNATSTVSTGLDSTPPGHSTARLTLVSCREAPGNTPSSTAAARLLSDIQLPVRFHVPCHERWMLIDLLKGDPAYRERDPRLAAVGVDEQAFDPPPPPRVAVITVRCSSSRAQTRETRVAGRRLSLIFPFLDSRMTVPG